MYLFFGKRNSQNSESERKQNKQMDGGLHDVASEGVLRGEWVGDWHGAVETGPTFIQVTFAQSS